MENRGLGLEEARKIIGVSYPTMLQLVNRNDFPAFRIGKKWVVLYDQLIAWMEKQARGGE